MRRYVEHNQIKFTLREDARVIESLVEVSLRSDELFDTDRKLVARIAKAMLSANIDLLISDYEKYVQIVEKCQLAPPQLKNTLGERRDSYYKIPSPHLEPEKFERMKASRYAKRHAAFTRALSKYDTDEDEFEERLTTRNAMIGFVEKATSQLVDQVATLEANEVSHRQDLVNSELLFEAKMVNVKAELAVTKAELAKANLKIDELVKELKAIKNTRASGTKLEKKFTKRQSGHINIVAAEQFISKIGEELRAETNPHMVTSTPRIFGDYDSELKKTHKVVDYDKNVE